MPITTGAPVELLNRIQDPGGGRTSILGMYGKLMFITGEGYLFGRGIGEGREKWSFVWREELRFDDAGKVTHVLAPVDPLRDFDLTQEANYEPLAPTTPRSPTECGRPTRASPPGLTRRCRPCWRRPRSCWCSRAR